MKIKLKSCKRLIQNTRTHKQLKTTDKQAHRPNLVNNVFNKF